MENGRRTLLKIAGIAALGLGAKPALDALAASGGAAAEPKLLPHSKALKAKQWAMVVDTTRIKSDRDLEPLVSVCNKIHNVPKLPDEKHEIKWIWGEAFKHAFPAKEHEFVAKRVKQIAFPVLCNHCENPPCVRVCPTQATFKRNDGIVLMDFHRCIGCRFCMAACPYGSRSFNFRDPRPWIPKRYDGFPTRMKGVVEKCNFCAERLAVGKSPACVEASAGILSFGDLHDPDSDVRKLLSQHYTIRRKQALGTGPQVYYII